MPGDDEVRERDRRAAIDLVEQAADREQIVPADRDHRIDALRHAHTASEVRMLVHDLVPDEPAAQADLPAPAPTTGSTYRPTAPPATKRRPRVTRKTRNRVASLAIVAAYVGISVADGGWDAIGFGRDDDLDDSLEDVDRALADVRSALPTPSTADALTSAGYADLVSDLRAEAGATTVTEAFLYEQYAVVNLPATGVGGEATAYYYDGDLSETATASTGDATRLVDLADVDGDVVADLAGRIQGRVPGWTRSSVSIAAPGPRDEGAWIHAYATDEAGDGGYLAADRQGRVVRRYLTS